MARTRPRRTSGGGARQAKPPVARAGRAAEPTVGDVCAALDRIAPFGAAAEWDNVGLLAGRAEWHARRWLTALDLTDAVAGEVLQHGVQGLVLYHPPIFKGIRAITPAADGPTTLLPDLLAARVALLATHTAFDAAPGGTNDLLLDAFDVAELAPLEPLLTSDRVLKLAVFVPLEAAERLRVALAGAGAGAIGAYRECSFSVSGEGTFRGDETTHPVIGQRGRLERVAEVRLEMVVPRARVGEVVRALYGAHPYEEPAFDLVPLHEVGGRGQAGGGRVAALRKATRGDRLVAQLARRVDLGSATVVGDLKRPFRRVAAAAGSAGVGGFRDPETLYVTGEFKHHDALALQRRGVCALCLGHYQSERLVLPALRDRLKAGVPGLEIEVARSCAGPLRRLGGRAD